MTIVAAKFDRHDDSLPRNLGSRTRNDLHLFLQEMFSPVCQNCHVHGAKTGNRTVHLGKSCESRCVGPRYPVHEEGSIRLLNPSAVVRGSTRTPDSGGRDSSRPDRERRSSCQDSATSRSIGCPEQSFIGLPIGVMTSFSYSTPSRDRIVA